MNQKTLENLKGTWIGELLEISEEETQTATDALPEISENELEKTTEFTDDGKEITLPHLLGEMNQYERALNALIDKKDLQHKEICQKEHTADFEGPFSPEHEELHRLLKILPDEMWSSIKTRFPDRPMVGVIALSKGGKIFVTQKQKDPREEMIEALFGRAFGGIEVEVIRM